MRIVYFDCFAGISGDMALGALIDAGADAERLRQGLAGLELEGWELRVERVRKGAISATSVTVEVYDGREGRPQLPHCERNLSDIKRIIERSNLPDQVKEKSIAVFELLAASEAKIHNTNAKAIHFHEVGAVDSIVDTVGSILAIHLLGVEEVYSSNLPFSHGRIATEHGELPVPAPATLELLKGVPFTPVDVEAELITPTGAALLRGLAKGFGAPPSFTPTAIGYGAGKRNLKFPNVLRVIVGEVGKLSELGTWEQERMVLLETNIDDMAPQLCEHVMERLFTLGARDVFITPIQMKKSRPALLLSVLCAPSEVNPILESIFHETSTIGVRVHELDRVSLLREVVTVKTEYGQVRVKLARLGGKIINAAPEYEDCKALAQECGVPLKQVLSAAQIAAQSVTSTGNAATETQRHGDR